MEKTRNVHPRGALGALVVVGVLCLHVPSARADPADKVHLPTVVQGELEFELNGGYQQGNLSVDDGERQLIYEVGYGLTSWWKSELGLGTVRLQGGSTHRDELEWENTFALTEPGEYWLDLGLFAELDHDYSGSGNSISIGPLLQKEVGAMQANLNLLFQRGLGSLAAEGTEFNYAWQLKWRGNPRFEPGVQGFGTLGSTGELGHPFEHKLGPAVFSQVQVSDRNKLKADAALLFGLNRNSPNTTVRFTLEFEIY